MLLRPMNAVNAAAQDDRLWVIEDYLAEYRSRSTVCRLVIGT